MSRSPITSLPPFDPETKSVNVIIETPRGSRNKFTFDPELGLFTLGSILPAGATFPYDFGFVPGTLGEDGDPLDVLLMMDCPAFPGCRVTSRLIGVIEAEQVEDGKKERNDRLVAVATEAHENQDLKTLKEVNSQLLKELEHFFVSYNQMRGKEFKLLGHRGPTQAKKLLDQGIALAKKATSK
ncbi:MAG: inorganic diphosphatase [Planctomycetaceae bacterium]|nr:inorganic diphosphatase [Planctomycetaceae bacterium]